MTSPYALQWVEKYRPTSIKDVALTEENSLAFGAFLSAGEIPHLLFTGPPGCGKTTVARILLKALDCEVLALNASKERGIDVVRGKIGLFAKAMAITRWKIVFLDEADGLTADAQDSLRNMIEEFSDQTRFILTANHPSRVSPALQSRCQIFEFGETPARERALVLKSILEKENIPVDLSIVVGYAEKFRDLRRMIGAAHKSVLANKGTLGPASAVAFSGPELLALVFKKDWNGLIKCASDPSFDHRQALTNMFWGIQDDMPQPTTMRSLLAKAVEHPALDPVVHFLGTCADILLLLK